MRENVAYGTIIIENGKYGISRRITYEKILIAIIVLAMFASMLSTVTFASELKEVNLTVSQLQVGYYTDLNGALTLHCANDDITKETKNLVDNKSYPYYWSKPYKFNDLKGYGGNVVPAILIDVANGGDGVAICGFEMQLREYMDCIPYSFEIQATLSSGSNEWTKIFADNDTAAKWAGDEYHCEFDEVTAYKVRILFYDIGDADVSKDTAYGTLSSDSTRFSLSEINLLAKRNTTSATEPATEPSNEATRPSFTVPVTQPSEAPTQAPTDAPTEAPTAAPTEEPTRPTYPIHPTMAPTTAPTAAPTEAPTDSVTDAPTAAPTEAPTAAPTEPDATTEPTTATDATTEPATQPATEPAVTPTEPATQEPSGVITTVPATAPTTQPDATTGNSGSGNDGTSGVIIGLIIAGIVVAAGIAGTCVFFIVKKKRS